jgi:large subunit ribosomal protein L10
MSKPMKGMLIDDYKSRFADVENALVLDIRGVNARDNNGMRLSLLKKNIRVTVVKNTLARKAFEGTSLAALDQAFDGPAALVYGGDNVVDVAREIIDWAKKVKNLTLKAACLDGIYFEGEEGVKRLSKFPTRGEALAKVVQIVLSPARNVIGCAVAPGARLMGVVKTIEDKLEKGEAIARV